MYLCAQAGVFLYGKVRRSDWLPVDGSGDEQLQRSADSMSEGEFEAQDRELEENYSGSDSDSAGLDDSDYDDRFDHWDDSSDDLSDDNSELGGLGQSLRVGGGLSGPLRACRVKRRLF